MVTTSDHFGIRAEGVQIYGERVVDRRVVAGGHFDDATRNAIGGAQGRWIIPIELPNE